LTGIDPLTGFGTDLIEAMLATAGSLEIPVVTHGGRTLALEPVAYREYGTLTHLVNVNWSVSSSPVIIAHCGLCCLSEEEAITTLDVLNRLFERYPNLMADISNLEPQILRLVMENVDHNRLIFGSDALYIPIWKSWVRFLHSLRLISQNPDDDLIRIASLNPIHCLKLQHMHDTLSFNN
jgi:predicted TIM-barrel fold metal-dependent hydrolase